MSETGVDPAVLQAWLSARSIARGLPAPVAEYGGFRVDTHSDDEVTRWVFPHMGPGLVELARSLKEPGHFLKLCGQGAQLQSVLPEGWALHSPSHFMRSGGRYIERPLAPGYRIRTDRNGAVVEVRIETADGELAASGYAAETPDAFVYDRIVTAQDHRRKGLGNAVMAALRRAKTLDDTPELLVATEDGRALYTTLGWRTLSPYSTASILGV